MPKRKKVVDAGEEQRKQKLQSLVRQFDAEVERRLYQIRRDTDQFVVSIENTFKMALFRMSPAEKQTNWESMYEQLCGVAGSGSSGPASLPVELAALSSETTSAVDAVLASKRAGGAGPARRGRPAKTPNQAGMDQLATPLQPPVPLEASTPLVRAKFDPATVLKKAPGTVRRQRPNELLMSLRGSPVVPAQKSPAGVDTPAPGLRPQTADWMQQIQAATRLVQEQPDALALEQDSQQLLLQLRDGLNAMSSLCKQP